MKAYFRLADHHPGGRAWTGPDKDAGSDRLQRCRLMTDGEQLTDVGGGPHFGSGLIIDTAGELFSNRS